MIERRSEDGAIAILVALLSIVLFGFGALVVDIGHAQQVRSQAQSTVDAASLAGVRVLATPGKTPADAADTVKDYVSENMGIAKAAWKNCTDPDPLTLPADTDASDTCISTLTGNVPGVTSFQVRVKLPVQHVPATFGGLFGVNSIAVSPIAQALSGQPLPPECGPCDPALDESTGQPTPQPPPGGLPATIRAMLPPDPKLQPPDPATLPPGVLDNGCPGPGVYEGSANDVTVPAGTCTLHAGLYVFDDANLDIAVGASLASSLSGGTPGEPPIGTGVTLVFYGTAKLTVHGHIGVIDEVDHSKRDPLIASVPSVVWQPGQPIPGVAIVFDEVDQSVTPVPRTFALGDDFDITGSVYALDGHTTWVTSTDDCMPAVSTCAVHDEDGAQSLIASTATDFSDRDQNGIGRIPTVATDHPMAEPPPSPPHLVK